MADGEPVAERSLTAASATPTPRVEGHGRLVRADTYLLATVRPDGQPHVMPSLAVYLDGAWYFSAGAATRTAKNLAHNARCVISTGGHHSDLVVEGDATKVSDGATLHRVAAAYAAKYGWQVTVRDGAMYGDAASPAPCEVYEVTPTTAYAFGRGGS